MDKLSKYPHLMRYLQHLKPIPGGSFHFGVTPHDYESRHVDWLFASVANLFGGKRRPSISPNELWDRKTVAISPFRIGETPVTWGIWKEYCKATSLRMPDDPGWGYPNDHPVVNISWDDIMKPGHFADWVTQVAGYKLTLPTDIQMEYAVRGGKDGQLFPWGSTFDAKYVWCSNSLGDAKQTAPVHRTNRIYRNSYGLTDVVGNVMHWVADYHVLISDFKPEHLEQAKKYYQNAQMVCVRGGSWLHSLPGYFQCEHRLAVNKNHNAMYHGFRLAAESR